MYLFSPLNNEFPQMIVASTHRDLKRNILVIAEKINDDKLPRGQIVEVVGACGDPLAERKAIHVAYSPDYWTKIPETIEPSSFFFRSVLDVPTINIDPPGCQDIDDCISIWEDAGITKVAITIADVAEWVSENPWMTHAQNIGQSLYDGGGSVRSMFPKTVEHKMSLMPGERRLGYALMFTWDGYVRDPQFKEVTIINKASYTYDNCRLATEISIPILRSICEQLAGRPLLDPHDWVAECNRLQKFAKKHARDLAFMDILQRRPENTPGIVVSSTRVWVSDWSRMITCSNDILPGTPVIIRYFLDMQRPTWKERLVFHIKIDPTLVH
jgi:hypothetical protein